MTAPVTKGVAIVTGGLRRVLEKIVHADRLHRFCAGAVVIGLVGVGIGALRSGPVAIEASRAIPIFDGYTATRLTGPARTVVQDAAGRPVATLTDGARTTDLAGPSRTFADPRYTPATVITTAWVRLLPQPWTAGGERQPWFRDWLTRTLQDRSPDVLAVAMQYTADAPDQRGAGGLRFAGRAGFGPARPGQSKRATNSDFYDYLAVPWTFPGGRVELPKPAHAGDVDSAGFLRLVWGYRMGVPLRVSDAPGPGLPRRVGAIAADGPGRVVIADRHQSPSGYGRLQPGDLVFFDVDPEVDRRVDHAGIYLGVDDTGRHRFISSRATADGPTFGDLGGASLLDSQHYGRAFRSARRI